MAIIKCWTEPEKKYRSWYKSQENFALGQVQFVQVEDDIWVANIIGQHNIGKSKSGIPPIRYDAVREFAKEMNASDSHAANWMRACGWNPG